MFTGGGGQRVENEFERVREKERERERLRRKTEEEERLFLCHSVTCTVDRRNRLEIRDGGLRYLTVLSSERNSTGGAAQWKKKKKNTAEKFLCCFV